MNNYLPVLRKSSFFLGLSDEEILSILHCINATVIRKDKNNYIFHSGESTDVMGIVLEGSALIIQEDIWGHRNLLSKCKIGDFFGEPYAAKKGSILNISVVAEEQSTIMLLNVNKVLTTCSTACNQHQKIIHNLVGVLANKILIFNEKITHISKRTTKDKLLSYLSSESLKAGSLEFDIPYNRQELADYLCVERAAMSAEISKLQKEGIIKTTKNHFTLFADANNY